MKNNIQILNNYYKHFKNFDETRIRQLYDKLQYSESIKLQTFSIETIDQTPQEITRIEIEMPQSNHFSEQVEIVIQYFLTHWNNISSILTLTQKDNEYNKFKEWFNELLLIDIDENGLALDNAKHFVACWYELIDEYNFTDLYDVLEEEELV